MIALDINGQFRKFMDMDSLPRNVDIQGDPVYKNRYYQTKKGLLVHATTEDAIPSILKNGIKPRCKTRRGVWGEERVKGTLREQVSEILECREKHVYFWNDYYEGVGQAMATVSYKREGEPAVVVVNTEGLELKRDPEDDVLMDDDLDLWEQNQEDSVPVSLIHRGTIPPERIEAVCTPMRNMTMRSTGELLCPMMHGEESCKKFNFDEFFEEIRKVENWECRCKEELGEEPPKRDIRRRD